LPPVLSPAASSEGHPLQQQPQQQPQPQPQPQQQVQQLQHQVEQLQQLLLQSRSSLFSMLEATFCQLSKTEQRRCEQLGIFLEGEAIPYAILRQLWAVDPEPTLQTLCKWRLVEVNAERQTVSLLDLHGEYIRRRAKNELPGWHTALLATLTERVLPVEGHAYWGGGEEENDWAQRLLHHAREAVPGEPQPGVAVLPSVEVLDLGNEWLWLEPKDAAVVGNIIRFGGSLTSLDVGWSSMSGYEFNEEAALSIVRAARQQDKMKTLGFGRCGIGASGAREIVEYMRVSGALTSLDLQSNQIGAEGAKAIGEALRLRAAPRLTQVLPHTPPFPLRTAHCCHAIVRAAGSERQ
jgi:hypothetical protein